MNTHTLFDGHGWRVSLESAPLPDGRVKTAARARRTDTVHIIALTSPRTILLLREFRPFFGGYVWMLPSGKIDKETDHATAAQRELREETGYSSADLRLYGTCHHAEGLQWTSYIYIAQQLSRDPLPQDDTELIEVHECDIEDAIDRVISSSHVHTASAYALLRYAREMKI